MIDNYVILTDISADILPETIAKHDIQFVPMKLDFGGEEVIVSKPFDESELKDFYEKLKGGLIVRSSQISPQNYIDAFEQYLKKGVSILYLCLSGGLSGTYQNSVTAANELNKKYAPNKVITIDSLTATAGMGFLLDFIGENKANGMRIDDNAKWVEENKTKIDFRFMIDDLACLRRGGRIPASLALLGSILNIKPILKFAEDGSLITAAKKQGTKNAINYMFQQYADSRLHEDDKNEKVVIGHSNSIENARILEAKVRQLNPEADIKVIPMGPIIGCHAGPGLCGIGYFIKK